MITKIFFTLMLFFVLTANAQHRPTSGSGTELVDKGTTCNFEKNPVQRPNFAVLRVDVENYPDLTMEAYSVFDQNGNERLRESFSPVQKHAFDVSSLEAGLYFVRVQLNEYIDDTNFVRLQLIVE